MNTKIAIHSRNLEARKQTLETWEISQQDKKDILKFLEQLGLGKINQGKKISEMRQLKYLDILKTPFEYFNKPISNLTPKDTEDFDKALTSNKIQSFKKKPFAHSTKADIRRLLRIYLKWKFGDTEKYRKLAGWFDTREPKKTPDYLSEPEIVRLYKACKTSKERFIVSVLFDAGCRIEEFLNIRYEDIQLPKGKDNFVKITLKVEYSKTQGRTISLYWKHSLEAVRDMLLEREKEGIKSSDAVIIDKYDNLRQFLYRIGNNALGKNIHAHLLRHSSATYYAPKLNRQELCYRYGWAFSSDMPDVYISRAGMESKQLDEKFSSTELEDLKKQIDKLNQDNEITKLNNQAEYNKLKKHNQVFAKVLGLWASKEVRPEDKQKVMEQFQKWMGDLKEGESLEEKERN